MTTVSQTDFARNWQDIAANLLKLGATAYGGPAIMGIMQAELQEKRQWVSKERFVEGLSLVNMLPGASAAQLSMFLGYARGGWGRSAWRTVLCPPRVLHLAGAHDGLCSPGRHPHHARRALWPGAR